MSVGSLENQKRTPFEESKIVKMNGLRVYFNMVDTNTLLEQRVFYSRRTNGPYYRWHYEKELGQWRGSRVHLSDSALREFCVASWKAVPMALQARLGEHYLE